MQININFTWIALWKNLMAVSCSVWAENKFPIAHQEAGEFLSSATKSWANVDSCTSACKCHNTVLYISIKSVLFGSKVLTCEK